MTARKVSYGGTSAYELERVGSIPEIPLDRPGKQRQVNPGTGERVKVSPETEKRLRERVKARTAARTVTKQYISPFAIVGFFCVGIMLIMMLVSYIQLTEVTDQTAQLETRLSELNETADKLELEYETAFNITELENYARNELGMSEPTSNQIYYLEGQQSDRSYILAADGSDKDLGILTTLADFFGSLIPS